MEPSYPLNEICPLPDEDAQALTTSLITCEHVLVEATTRMLEALDESLTIPQFRTLAAVETLGAMSLSDLAKALDVRPSTAMRMIDRLEGRRLAVKGVSPIDKRETVILLTPRGHHLVVRGLYMREQAMCAIVERMSEDMQNNFIKGLHEFVKVSGHEPRQFLPSW
ncbi:MarR family winged helix-turn-helix transcriptional regulator [Streptomyces sp. NBC_01451]|uniref:MarR family winged helix-turn-helix transcriptional regulator n=1 Tax=Streptomyces sp. NBC_01451 TaxID=2903872 RepID=UPI003FCC792D